IDRNVVAEPPLTHVLGEEPALERLVVEEAPGGDELWAVDLIGARIELAAFPGDFAPKDRKAAGVAVVQDLHYLGLLVAHPEIALVDHERAAKRIEQPKERRDGRRPAREDGFVAKGAQGEEPARLPGPVVAAETEIRQLIEAVVYPGEKDVVGGDCLEA